ncbi:MAG: bifunctional hydroxymethylpyrimidine kinase/phosphomethylpyrimidine kinase [Candidatus Dactylopiibacterium carminicum]|uniref:hydroxymethylpyrimidine kinase n=1 Tax=Candidatus Dactylopiibacterium carminicum TaxID=857335 RepID=A0A272EXM9_9RHOO|nr:bifunctional hydroxymethylpyrimidine kinase/phosphomethylpyrimidine kinase [Candidatus Dactylopiibacterium carminicum]KAF7600185.1 bifunctional hydroxymethylpyrimidine kinase/phosphomethylpyrimidine kinase [Candidatus Dactylopiibacterium carminicum]PAS94796.1 MAG: bifunctional hydroxymethylpyrimidine kinase/phosphomethylpyrimidine kinase [Candidatus Dactylopiibacterium carminicum]PAS97720.1 MAG: bifunctional hydroxymethylpyrimidine kinase/phosphomethylpyrimidine kinase [Candidatus Dactylopiib
MSNIPNVVSIAGVDPSGGAGVLADIKSFTAQGTYGCGVIAALTAQNTQGVTGVHVPPTDFLRLQIDTLFADVPIHAVKLGMLGSAEIVSTVAERLAHWRAPFVVCDPVMVAKSGDHLLARSAVAMLIEALLPQTFLITPNLPEAGVLLEARAPETVKEMYRAAERLRDMLPTQSERWVLLKGGHLPGNEIVDLLFDGDRMIEMPAPRIATRNTHGTGCSLSSAIAALLPQTTASPAPVEEAVRRATQWLRQAIARSGELAAGQGHGPVHHFHALWK